MSILKCFPPCGGDIGIVKNETKVKKVQKIYLPACGFEAQQKKMPE